MGPIGLPGGSRSALKLAARTLLPIAFLALADEQEHERDDRDTGEPEQHDGRELGGESAADREHDNADDQRESRGGAKYRGIMAFVAHWPSASPYPPGCAENNRPKSAASRTARRVSADAGIDRRHERVDICHRPKHPRDAGRAERDTCAGSESASCPPAGLSKWPSWRTP